MPIAFNDKTGQALRLDGDKWVSTQIADDGKGNRVIYDGKSWQSLSSPAKTEPKADAGTLGYVGTRGLGGLLEGGKQLATGANLEMGYLDDADETSKLRSGQDTANRAIYGTTNVPAPNAVARYAGEVAASAGTNPVLAAVAPGATITSSLGSEAGSDLNKATGSRVPDWLARLFGGLAGGATSATKVGLKPPPPSDAKTLIDSGVRLTPGQQAAASGGRISRVLGSGIKDVEDTASGSVLGGAVKHGREIAMGDFRRATLNKALEPIGETLSKDAKTGRQAVTEAGDKLTKAYDELLPKLTYKTDAQFDQDMAKIDSALARLPRERADQFRGILEDAFKKRLGKDGSMDGQSFKESERELSSAISEFDGTTSADERAVARLLKQARDAMWGNLERVNPEQASRLGQIDKSYAMLARVQGAAGRRAIGEAEFTPGDLLQAIKSADKSARDVRFVEGKEPLQDFAETAHRVLASEAPKSNNAVAFTAAAPTAAAFPLYTGPVMRVINKLAKTPRLSLTADQKAQLRVLLSQINQEAASQ
jgi:hypothetical protein